MSRKKGVSLFLLVFIMFLVIFSKPGKVLSLQLSKMVDCASLSRSEREWLQQQEEKIKSGTF